MIDIIFLGAAFAFGWSIAGLVFEVLERLVGPDAAGYGRNAVFAAVVMTLLWPLYGWVLP